MEFKEFFSLMKNRISNGADVPYFFRDLIAMITDVSEEDWGTPKDDSLLFKNLGKDVEDGIFRIYTNTDKQIFIAYDKQGDCRPETRKILEDNSVLRLSTDNCELYGRSWDTEE